MVDERTGTFSKIFNFLREEFDFGTVKLLDFLSVSVFFFVF